ncbi:hypothetical protein ACFQAV_00960 [Companilactobacillus huachuanensis]|uniref:SHOCT domain-containing protein n=1 Tax=Companilactobacillus huachuanensis TaxID=2559914 RepID=A0ABW1RJ22_9LACO|nr:hypothetical protein [Companilactobacillus huachuanensis]
MMRFGNCGSGFGGMGFMGGGFWLYSIIILLIIIAAVYLINNNHNHRNKVSALEVLNQEYAKGNVSDDDYKKRKENLNS